MEEKRKLSTSVVLVSLSLLFVLVCLGVIFFHNLHREQTEGIMLPGVQSEPKDPMDQDPMQEDSFVQVNPDNVLPVLESIQRPAYYSQSYTVTVGTDQASAEHTVDLWINGSHIYGEVRDRWKTKSILTDGVTAWIWYDVDPTPVSMTLSRTIQCEDLLGLPGFDYLSQIRHTPVTDADYLVLEESNTQCIFACTQDDDTTTNRYWIDLSSGLLYRADVLRNSQLVYQIRENSFSPLAPGDESFSGKFALPDGTEPFTIGADKPPQQ